MSSITIIGYDGTKSKIAAALKCRHVFEENWPTSVFGKTLLAAMHSAIDQSLSTHLLLTAEFSCQTRRLNYKAGFCNRTKKNILSCIHKTKRQDGRWVCLKRSIATYFLTPCCDF